MQLFKRMILSLFPDEMVNNPMNPASVFVGFISSKQYFSVITRKIVENYKLNLFDISLDPFEVKIGFGDSPTIKVKDVDFYYGYAAAANLNGYRSFAPGQVAHAVSLVTGTTVIDSLREYDDYYTIQFLYAVYLLTFIFQSKCKIFPKGSKNENFSWFIDVLISLYTYLLEQSGKKFSGDIVIRIKNDLVKNHIEVLFMLYYFYQYASKSLEVSHIQPSQFYGRLLYDELKGGPLQPIAQDFIKHADKTCIASTFSTTEKNLIHLFFPADILIRYLIENNHVETTFNHLISHFYDQEKIKYYLHSFLKNDSLFEEYLTYITDYTHFKTTYFDAMKKYITHVFQKQDPYEIKHNEEIDDWMSSIGEGGAIDMGRIPARLKQESETMERLMNFYITYIGGYWIGRGDSWYIRSFYQDCVKEIMKGIQTQNKHDALYYFSGLLYSYSKNVFYYKYAFENIRAGKDKFHLPFRATFREVYSNACIIKLFESSFISTLLQDLLSKDIKIYTKNSAMIDVFATYFKENISQLVRQKGKGLLDALFSIYDEYCLDVDFSGIITSYFGKPQFYTNIKENIYSPDFWIYITTITSLKSIIPLLQEKYGSISICGMLSTLRETCMGFFLYISYVSHKSKNKDIQDHIDELYKIYLLDIVNIGDEFIVHILPILKQISQEYDGLFTVMHGIDDNIGYLDIATDNRHQFCYEKKSEEIFGGLSGEDIIRFRGFLKTITYYNKRYVIPQ